MSDYTRSDLACESMECEHPEGGKGTEFSEELHGEIQIKRAEILTKEAANRIGREVGIYVTFECGRIDRLSKESHQLLVGLLARELQALGERMTNKRIGGGFGVFVAGLGNEELTADAIGPRAVRGVSATRHLKDHEADFYKLLGCASLSTLAPGVLGQTGIETLEILRGAVRSVQPDLVIVIDALAARSCARLASTVQLSSEGILPGSGVGNHRSAINRASLGVPVIAVGVPTVVNSATLVYDALHKAGIGEPEPALRRVLEEGESFFVSPRECDLIAKRVGDLLSEAVGKAFSGALFDM